MCPARELGPKSPLFNAVKKWHGGYFDSQTAPQKSRVIPGFPGSHTRISASQKLCAAPAAGGQRCCLWGGAAKSSGAPGSPALPAVHKHPAAGAP